MKRNLTKFNSIAVLAIALSLFFVFTACGGPDNNEQDQEKNSEAKADETTEENEIIKEDEIKLYFTEDTGTDFVKVYETRSVDTITPEETMDLFLQGPENEDYFGAEVVGVEILGVTVEDGMATVDFSEELYDMSLGHQAEAVFVDTIVYTITQFEEIDQVQILVEGDTAEPISGHIDISEPLSR